MAITSPQNPLSLGRNSGPQGVSIEQVWKELQNLKTNSPLPDHFHNRNDSSAIQWASIDQKKFYITHTLIGAVAATAGNYGVFMIAPADMNVVAFSEVHAVAGSNAGAVTVQLEKLTGATAAGSGTVVLTTALSLKATANTVQAGVITTVPSTRAIARGNRLALKLAGTPTDVDTVSVILELTLL